MRGSRRPPGRVPWTSTQAPESGATPHSSATHSLKMWTACPPRGRRAGLPPSSPTGLVICAFRPFLRRRSKPASHGASPGGRTRHPDQGCWHQGAFPASHFQGQQFRNAVQGAEGGGPSCQEGAPFRAELGEGQLSQHPGRGGSQTCPPKWGCQLEGHCPGPPACGQSFGACLLVASVAKPTWTARRSPVHVK